MQSCFVCFTNTHGDVKNTSQRQFSDWGTQGDQPFVVRQGDFKFSLERVQIRIRRLELDKDFTRSTSPSEC